MFVLRTEYDLTAEQKEILRHEIKERTGEDCIILANGLRLESVQIGKKRPWWRKMLRRT